MTCIISYPTALPIPIPPTGRTTDEEQQCMGIGMTLSEWQAYWTSTSHLPCDQVFNRLLYPATSERRQFSRLGFKQAAADFEYMFSQYFGPPDASGKGGHRLTVPGQPGYNNFQQILLDACTLPQFAIQGVCQQAARQMCLTCTREEIIANPAVLRLCGCNAPALDPRVYKGVTRACDPLCAQALVSKIREPYTGVVDQCTANICVINDVSIEASKSTIGGVNFTQVCPQCSQTQQCNCIVDTTIPNAEIVGLVDPVIFRQYCGENSICLTIDNATQTIREVPCASAITPLEPRTFTYTIPGWVWIVALVLLIVGILVILALFTERPVPMIVTETAPISNNPPHSSIDFVR